MSEMTMLERVARAIADAAYGEFTSTSWEDYLDEANAAIRAMREPTSSMEAAMSDAEGDTLGTILTTPLSKVYVAAIDAALSETP